MTPFPTGHCKRSQIRQREQEKWITWPPQASDPSDPSNMAAREHRKSGVDCFCKPPKIPWRREDLGQNEDFLSADCKLVASCSLTSGVGLRGDRSDRSLASNCPIKWRILGAFGPTWSHLSSSISTNASKEGGAAESLRAPQHPRGPRVGGGGTSALGAFLILLLYKWSIYLQMQIPADRSVSKIGQLCFFWVHVFPRVVARTCARTCTHMRACTSRRSEQRAVAIIKFHNWNHGDYMFMSHVC